MKLSKTFLFLTLLALSRSSPALSLQEKSCIAKTIYIECRDKRYCTKNSWRHILSVIRNRQQAYTKWKFGAKSPNACHIVSSWEFSGAKLLGNNVKERKVYNDIEGYLETQQYKSSSDYLYFNPRKHRMNLRGSLVKLLGASHV